MSYEHLQFSYAVLCTYIAQWLRSCNKPGEQGHRKRRYIYAVRDLADKGADLNEISGCGSDYFSTTESTPLECAVWFNQPNIINLLIDKGADLGQIRYDTTPLSIAAAYGINKSAKVLPERGADPNAGKPLSNAAYKGNIELMKLLISKGADIDTAIEHLKTWYDSWLPDNNKKIDSAVRLLEKQKPRQEIAMKPAAPQPVQTQSMTREEIAGIIPSGRRERSKSKG